MVSLTMLSGTSTIALTFKCSKLYPPFFPFPFFFNNKTHMDSQPKTLNSEISFSRSSTHSPPRESETGDINEPTISLQEWQAWGTTSPLPTMVADIVEELKVLETQSDAQMSFGGLGGKIKVTDPNPFTISFNFLCFEPCSSKLSLFFQSLTSQFL